MEQVHVIVAAGRSLGKTINLDRTTEIGTFLQPQSGMSKRASLHRERDILLLAERITMLPRVQKKLLALFYCENLPLADIAVCLGLSNVRTWQILIETVDLLQRRFLEITSPRRKIQRKANLDQQAESGISA